MLNPESVKKYFGQAELWELIQELRRRLSSGRGCDPADVQVDKLLILAEQALWPAWFHGYLAPEGMLVLLEPRTPGGCPEYGVVSRDEDGNHIDVYGCMTNIDIVEYLEQVKNGELIPATAVVEFVMSNPTLMKGLRFWIKQRNRSEQSP